MYRIKKNTFNEDFGLNFLLFTFKEFEIFCGKNIKLNLTLRLESSSVRIYFYKKNKGRNLKNLYV